MTDTSKLTPRNCPVAQADALRFAVDRILAVIAGVVIGLAVAYLPR